MKLSHCCIITRLRLSLSQKDLALKVRAVQSQIAEFESGVYHRMNANSTELLDNILLMDIGYDDLSWNEMAVLKLRANSLTMTRLSRILNVPVSQISIVISGKAAAGVSQSRINLVRRHIDRLALRVE